ncbi:AraC family transcriptional regulator [Brachybacterium vulturis]|uniref:AraC family transcriptional regulator n=1 Tax=Brachybacterium vulturis TaxID=2017484 RepID=UPI003735B03F
MAASADLVESVRELVLMDSASALRWFQHDYPHPLARWHHHPEIEIHLITGSSGTAQIGSAARAFGPGALYLIGSELPHNWVSSVQDGETVPGRDLLIQADPELLIRLAELVPDLNRIPPLLATARYGIQYAGATRERAVQVLGDIRDRRGAMRFAGLLELLDLLAGAPAHEREVLSEQLIDTPLGTDDSEIFHCAVTYLHEHLGERVQLADVAHEIQMSETHVSRLFSRATGVGFARTVIRLRVSEACRLLLRTDLPVADVCFRAGFTNLSNFNRRFREETGMTPRAYRAAQLIE